MISLTGKIALVTGGNQGIGEGIAEVFAESGAKVCIAARNADKGEIIVSRINSRGGEASWYPADLSTASGVQQLVSQVIRDHGHLDIVVHNAGVFPLATIEQLAEADLENTLAVNLKAAFWITQAAAPSMRQRGWGRLLFTSSVTGPRVAMPLLAHYAASKAGLNGFLRAASLEYARQGITVNAVEPGYILTQAMNLLVTAEEQKEMANQLPLGRLGDPRDIGYAMLYLASEQASYVTGQTIIVDGGSCTPESSVQLQAFYSDVRAGNSSYDPQ